MSLPTLRFQGAFKIFICYALWLRLKTRRWHAEPVVEPRRGDGAGILRVDSCAGGGRAVSIGWSPRGQSFHLTSGGFLVTPRMAPKRGLKSESCLKRSGHLTLFRASRAVQRLHPRDNVHLLGALWLGIAAGALAIPAAVRLFRRRPQGLGEVSGRWIAEHRATNPGDGFR